MVYKKLAIAVLLVVVAALPSRLRAAQPFATETKTVSTSPVGVTNNLCRTSGQTTDIPTGAIIEVTTGSINFLLHDAAVTPGATAHLLTVGGVLELVAPYKFVAVRNGGSDATIRVTCIEGLTENKIFKLPIAGGAASNVTITDGVDTAQVSTTSGGSLQVECTAGCSGVGLTASATFQTAVTATAAQLATNTAKVVCMSVKDGGTQTVYWGTTSGVTISTGQELLSGASMCRPFANSNQIWVIAGSTGSTVAVDVTN